MKKVFNSLFVALFALQMAFAQATLSSSNCSNYNAFRTSSTYSNLEYYADKISPTGIIILNLSKSNEYGGVEDLYPLLGVGQGTTFQLIKETSSHFDEGKYYRKYQQYYQGVKVEGGGYTVGYYIGDGPGDPCDVAFMVSPHIANNFNISVTPSVGSGSLGTILNAENGVQS